MPRHIKCRLVFCNPTDTALPVNQNYAPYNYSPVPGQYAYLRTNGESYNQSVMQLHGYENSKLDAVFAALSDQTRRKMLMRLSDGPATVTELAEPFTISQPAISKHLKVLEKAGLVSRGVDRQTRPAQLEAEALSNAIDWLNAFARLWSARMDRLDELLNSLQTLESESRTE